MDNWIKSTILLAILVTISRTVDSSCYLENLGTYPCTGRLHCTENFGQAMSLVRDWSCRRHESYDYSYNNYERVRIDEDYNIYISANEIVEALTFDTYGIINSFSDHILEISVVNSNLTAAYTVISGLQRPNVIDISNNWIEFLDLSVFSRNHLNVLNVSYNRIAYLETSDKSVSVSQIKSIDLSHNAIETIPNNYFRQCPDLLHLNLSYNSIESVDILTFEGITQLETLYISNNKLSKLGVYFARFVQLQELSLDYNHLKFIEESSFNMMTSLRTLNISSNQLMSIESSSFNRLQELISLDLSNNKIDTVPKTLLQHNIHLSLLDVSNNSISKLETGAFEGKTITDFRIQNNKLAGCLEKNTFQGIYVDELDLSVANITELGPSLFEGLNGTLQSLNFSSNSISKIHTTTFSKLELLSTLDLSHNKLQDIEFDMTDLKNLSYLYINNNYIKNITQNMFKGLVSLKTIDLSNNDIDLIEILSFEDLNDLETLILNNNPLPLIIASHMFSGLTSCIELHLKDTKINILQNNAFNGMNSLGTFNMSKGTLKTLEFNVFNSTGSMETLDLSFNQIEIFLINNTNINFVKNINLNYNKLQFITKETFSGLINLQFLDIEHNNIVRIENGAFSNLQNLLFFSFNGNKDMVFNSTVFSNIPSVQVIWLNNVTAQFTFENIVNTSIFGLDISFCDIVDVSSVQVYRIKTIKELNLSSNRIRSIDKSSFQKLRHLSWLDLSYNKISNIQPGSFNDSVNLSILKLNNNYLTSLQFGMLDGLVNLQILNLSSNTLHTCKANIFYNTPHLQEVFLDNNIIDDINFSEFAAANINKISIGGNSISCDSLTNFKNKQHIEAAHTLQITAEEKNYGTENVGGITCSSMIKFHNASRVHGNETILTAALLNTIAEFRITVERLLNRNESKENPQKIDFKDVSLSIEHFIEAFNKTETANNVFLEKLAGINNSTNWYLGNIQKFLKEHGNATKEYNTGVADTELKDKDIEKILSGMLEKQRDSLRIEFKSMLEGLKSHNVGNKEFASQTANIDSSTDLKSALYFIATCLATLLCVMILAFVFVYFKFKSKLSHNNSLYSSRQPISNVMEME